MTSPFATPFAPVIGASGATYHSAEGGLEALQRRYYDLVERFGGLAPAIVAIASMLDIPSASGAFEATRPDVVRLLLEASERLRIPLPGPVAIGFLGERAPGERTTLSPAARIAEVCHEANRAYCYSLGDFSQVAWPVAPEWQRKSAIHGVEAILNGEVNAPSDSHKSWMAEKLADGWEYGETKDPGAKTHPCLVPYEELPLEQRIKDELFFAIVAVLGLGIEVKPPGTVDVTVELSDGKKLPLDVATAESPEQPPKRRHVVGLVAIEPAELKGKTVEEALDQAWADLRPRMLAQVADALEAIAKAE